MEVAGEGLSKEMSFYLKDQRRLLVGPGWREGGREEAGGGVDGSVLSRGNCQWECHQTEEPPMRLEQSGGKGSSLR